MSVFLFCFIKVCRCLSSLHSPQLVVAVYCFAPISALKEISIHRRKVNTKNYSIHKRKVKNYNITVNTDVLKGSCLTEPNYTFTLFVKKRILPEGRYSVGLVPETCQLSLCVRTHTFVTLRGKQQHMDTPS